MKQDQRAENAVGQIIAFFITILLATLCLFYAFKGIHMKVSYVSIFLFLFAVRLIIVGVIDL